MPTEAEPVPPLTYLAKVLPSRQQLISVSTNKTSTSLEAMFFFLVIISSLQNLFYVMQPLCVEQRPVTTWFSARLSGAQYRVRNGFINVECKM